MLNSRRPWNSLVWITMYALAVRAVNGDSTCTDAMCITATVNGSDIEYVLKSKLANVGWMAIGFGTQMADSEMVIVWPNSDGSATISQRNASGHVMPFVDREVMHPATLSPISTSLQGSEPQIAFTVPVTSDTRIPLIWAFSSVKPGDASRGATIRKHDTMGALTFDLSSSPDTGSRSGFGSESGSNSGPEPQGGGLLGANGPLKSYERLFVAHAVLTSLGFLLVLPLGALFARWLRTYTGAWFAGHWMLQFVIAGPLILIGAALGIAGIEKGGYSHLNDTHKKLGVALFVLYFVQIMLGAVVHWVKPAHPGRPLQNYAHAFLGLLIVALSFYQVRTGYKVEWMNATMRHVPNGVDKAFIAWAVIFPVLYVAGLFLLQRQRRQERRGSGGPGPRRLGSHEEKPSSTASLVAGGRLSMHSHHGLERLSGDHSSASQYQYPAPPVVTAHPDVLPTGAQYAELHETRPYHDGYVTDVGYAEQPRAENSFHDEPSPGARPAIPAHYAGGYDPTRIVQQKAGHHGHGVPYHLPTGARYPESTQAPAPSTRTDYFTQSDVPAEQATPADHPAAKYYTGRGRDLPKPPPQVHHDVRELVVSASTDMGEAGQDGRYYRSFEGRDRDRYCDSLCSERSSELFRGH